MGWNSRDTDDESTMYDEKEIERFEVYIFIVIT